ncbi:MAG TPA: hypothetical protein VFE82_05685 [Ramlibacter sp.]|jgi:hypothetical protein|uniref:hypothetical protein n=1 Tax=Ramlibacter sp. TaxID=1917967 RepID=UPI002D56B6A1|nr:hypothetical protein [Ramlibacter sp.]HZY17953.1 hypothetical protein [Ramlibacter sp.]
MSSRAPLALLLACAATLAHGQPAGDDAAQGRRNQKVERIHHEDGANRIDEVRYGGQTESITVQPKANVPAYEVAPANLSRSRPGDDRNGLSAAGGQRSWNLLRF